MKKRDFFLAAMKSRAYLRKTFVISLFSLIREDLEAYKLDMYPYRVVQTPTAHFFVDPENGNQLTKIDDALPNVPIFNLREEITLSADDGVDNFVSDNGTGKGTLNTTYGRLVLNYIVLIYPFGKKFPYLNKKLSPREIEDQIIARLKDTPKEGEERSDDFIYVDEYLKFCNAAFYMTGFSQIAVPALSEKAITPAPGITELRDKLLKENEGKLTDPAVIAKIDAQLQDYDRAYLKGDSSEGFLVSEKSINIVRKRLFSMYGAEAGFGDGTKMDLLSNSLTEEWNVDKFDTINNSLRAGSYSRGAETMLGGESVKWLMRTSSNMGIKMDDCGTKLGMIVNITPASYKRLIGFSVIEGGKSVKIPDEDTAKKYIGRTVIQRSPMFCKAEKTDYCSVCCGDRLAATPTALSAAVTDFGSTLMLINMKLMHGKQLKVAKMNLKEAIF